MTVEHDLSDLPEVDRYYPVIVEETRRSVLWIQASTPDEAAELFETEPFDPPQSCALTYDWAAGPPDPDDWRYIQRGGEWWPGTQQYAHVQTWADEQWRRRREAETIRPVGGVL